MVMNEAVGAIGGDGGGAGGVAALAPPPATPGPLVQQSMPSHDESISSARNAE